MTPGVGQSCFQRLYIILERQFLGIARQYDVQWDTTPKINTRQANWYANIFYSETSQIACGLPVDKQMLSAENTVSSYIVCVYFGYVAFQLQSL